MGIKTVINGPDGYTPDGRCLMGPVPGQSGLHVLAGFSMGSVMSYAMALSGDRPAVAGILAFSGFIPTVDGWQPSFADRRSTRAFIAHGSRDSIIEVGFAQRARELVEAAGLDVTYRESEIGHQIDPSALADATVWLDETLPA